MSLASCWHHKHNQLKHHRSPMSSAPICWWGGAGGSAGGRAVQLICTLGLLSVLASEKEHTQHWEGGLVQRSPWQGFTPPHLLKPTEDDIKICFLACHDGESRDYAWVPYSLLGQIHPTLALIWESPQACVVSGLQLQGLHWIRARLCTGDMALHQPHWWRGKPKLQEGLWS